MLEYLDNTSKMMKIEDMNLNSKSRSYRSLGENIADTDNQQERLVKLTRLAMAIECEGHLTIGMSPASKTRDRISLYPTIGFTNTNRELVDEVLDILMKNDVGFSARFSAGRGAGKKIRFDVSIHGYGRVTKMLDLIQSHLRTKTRQAEILREFIESRTRDLRAEYSEAEWVMVTEIRILNGRSPNAKAIAKAKAQLESSESICRPSKAAYLQRYLKMCADLQRNLESAAEMTAPTEIIQ